MNQMYRGGPFHLRNTVRARQQFDRALGQRPGLTVMATVQAQNPNQNDVAMPGRPTSATGVGTVGGLVDDSFSQGNSVVWKGGIMQVLGQAPYLTGQ